VLGAALLVPVHTKNAADFFSEAPLHFLTVASMLASIGLVARVLEDGRRWGSLALLGVVSVDAAASDPMFVVLGSLPMVAALVLAELPDAVPRWRLAAGVLAAAALGRGLVALNTACGGFVAPPTPLAFAVYEDLAASLAITVRAVIDVLGCDPFGLSLRQAEIDLLRLPLLLVLGVPFYRLGWAVVARVRRRGKAPGFVETSLWLLAAAAMGVMLVTSKVHDVPSIRFILPAWAAACVLAARWDWKGWRVPIYATVLVVVALGADAQAVARSVPPAFTPMNQELADCLETLGLHEGYGTYWRASAVSLASGGAVMSRAVSIDWSTRALEPMMWMSDIGWYEPFPVGKAFFVISEPGDAMLPRPAVLARFGVPAASLVVDGAVVDVYGARVAPGACAGQRAPAVAVTADMPGNR
jgi:hypothetical protein